MLLGLMTVFGMRATISRLWPLPIALALGFILIIGKHLNFTRGAFDWFTWGQWGLRQLIMIVIVALVSGSALLIWYTVVHPNIADLASKIPRVHPLLLLVIGSLFSITNAICEECVWRGMIFNALARTKLPVAAVVGVQAISFGVAHWQGFPRGLSGIGLASIYGVIIGYVRQQANGLGAPIVAHVLADAAIYAILLSAALTQ
jgi:uncharacterized protein